MKRKKADDRLNKELFDSYVTTDDFIRVVDGSSLSSDFKERLFRHLRGLKFFEKPAIPSLILGTGFNSFAKLCKTKEDRAEFSKAVNIVSDTKRLPVHYRDKKNI